MFQLLSREEGEGRGGVVVLVGMQSGAEFLVGAVGLGHQDVVGAFAGFQDFDIEALLWAQWCGVGRGGVEELRMLKLEGVLQECCRSVGTTRTPLMR